MTKINLLSSIKPIIVFANKNKGHFFHKAAAGHQIEVIVNQFRKFFLFPMLEHHSTQRERRFMFLIIICQGGGLDSKKQESAFDFI